VERPRSTYYKLYVAIPNIVAEHEARWHRDTADKSHMYDHRLRYDHRMLTISVIIPDSIRTPR